MDYLRFCEALGLRPHEEVQKIYEQADLLKPLDTSWILPLMPRTGAMLLRLAEEVASDPVKLRYVNLLRACYWTLPENLVPILPQGPGKTFENLSPMLVLLSFVSQTEQEMERRNLPEEQRQWIRGGFENTLLTREKILGYPVLLPLYFFWRKRALTPNLFRIRDLEFELKEMNLDVTVYREKGTGRLLGLREEGQTDTEFLCTGMLRGGLPGNPVTLSKDRYERFVCKGDYVLGVHIPTGARIDPVSLDRSFGEAREFFVKYFPDRPAKCFYCCSWLMDPTLADDLSPASNIITFQRRFQCWPMKSTGREVFNFVHPKPFDSYEELPENTSLERMLKKRYLADDPIFVHAGLCLFS